MNAKQRRKHRRAWERAFLAYRLPDEPSMLAVRETSSFFGIERSTDPTRLSGADLSNVKYPPFEESVRLGLEAMLNYAPPPPCGTEERPHLVHYRALKQPVTRPWWCITCGRLAVLPPGMTYPEALSWTPPKPHNPSASGPGR